MKTKIRKAQAGVPNGGTINQALVKLSGADQDVDWADVAGGSGGGTKIAIQNTTTFPYTVTIPGGILGINNGFKFRMLISAASAGGGGGGSTFTVKYGGQTIGTLSIMGGNTSGASGCVLEGFITANGLTNAQKALITAISHSLVSGGSGNSPQVLAAEGALTVDSTVDQTLEVSVVNSNAGVTCEGIIVERISSGGNGSSTSNSGVATKDISDASTTQVIPHGLPGIPSRVSINAKWSIATNILMTSDGVFDGSGNKCTYCLVPGGSPLPLSLSNSTTASVIISLNSGNSQTGIITVDATNITITWIKSGTPVGVTAQLLWEANL